MAENGKPALARVFLGELCPAKGERGGETNCQTRARYRKHEQKTYLGGQERLALTGGLWDTTKKKNNIKEEWGVQNKIADKGGSKE